MKTLLYEVLGALALVLVSISLTACDSIVEKPFCNRICAPQGVTKWVSVRHSYDVCVCATGATHVTNVGAAARTKIAPKGSEESDAEHALRVATAAEDLEKDAREAVDALEEAAKELMEVGL